MTILKPAPVSTRQLTWVKDDGQWVGEISSTHGFGQVYDDACDEGLTLVSARTGNEVTFVVDHTEYCNGELLWWKLVPADFKGGMSILLFND